MRSHVSTHVVSSHDAIIDDSLFIHWSLAPPWVKQQGNPPITNIDQSICGLLLKILKNRHRIMVRLAALHVIVSATAISGAAAFSSQQQPNQPSVQDRRAALGGIAAGFLGLASSTLAPQEAEASKALTGQASPFTGDYDDPNHPGCLRQVKVVGPPLRADGTRSAFPLVEIKGWDGKDGEKMCTGRPGRGDLWSIEGKLLSKDTASLDFSSKGGPAGIKGVYQDDGIVFPDGNKWTKVVGGTPSRRPKDMSTLKSE